MTSVVFYFQLHQPFRVQKDYNFLNIGQNHFYEAADQNYMFLNRVADRCYLPVNARLLEVIKRTEGQFKVAFSISGVCLEQMAAWRPDVIDSFKELVDTGSVEILGETYYHSLSSVFSASEFQRQVKKHRDTVKLYLGVEPKTFRNTELVYSDKVASLVEKAGYKTVIAEGVERNLHGRTPNMVYKAGESSKLNVLLRNYVLSDDIAFRFCDPHWAEYPLLAPKYANWLHNMGEESENILIGVDYETFGEHRALETGILQFLSYLPFEVLRNKDFKFALPSELSKKAKPKEVYDSPGLTSWADADKDLSGWLDSHMQQDALNRVYALEEAVLATENENLIHTWGKLQTSDHFYYMSVRYWNDGVRQAFSPFDSPYEGYINYMNVLSDFEKLINS